jgi:hypothetical protein
MQQHKDCQQPFCAQQRQGRILATQNREEKTPQ